MLVLLSLSEAAATAATETTEAEAWEAKAEAWEAKAEAWEAKAEAPMEPESAEGLCLRCC
jgi:hypothetical protein